MPSLMLTETPPPESALAFLATLWPTRDLDDAPALPPERRLLMAILLQALRDAGVRVGDERYRPARSGQHRAAARAWLHSADCAEVCEWVGVDVARIRTVVQER